MSRGRNWVNYSSSTYATEAFNRTESYWTSNSQTLLSPNNTIVNVGEKVLSIALTINFAVVGYQKQSIPQISISAPDITGGTQATATPTYTFSSPYYTLTGITVTNPGSGYTTTPTVTITLGAGTGSPTTVTNGAYASLSRSSFEWQQTTCASIVNNAVLKNATAADTWFRYFSLDKFGKLYTYSQLGTVTNGNTTNNSKLQSTSLSNAQQLGSDTWLKISKMCYPNQANSFPTSTVGGNTVYTMGIGIKSDGTLWYLQGRETSTGMNSGYSSSLNYTAINQISDFTAVQIGTDTWKDIQFGLQNGDSGSARDAFVVGIKTNGTMWRWKSSNLTLVQIGSATNWETVDTIGDESVGTTTTGVAYTWTETPSATNPAAISALSSKTVTKIIVGVIGWAAITNESTNNLYSSYGFESEALLSGKKITDIGRTGQNWLICVDSTGVAYLGGTNPIPPYGQVFSQLPLTWGFIAGANSGITRSGSDFILSVNTGSSQDDTASINPINSGYWGYPLIINEINPPTLSVTPNFTGSAVTNGSVSLSIVASNCKLTSDWGDSSQSEYPNIINSSFTVTQGHTYTVTQDTEYTLTVTADSDRFTDATQTYSLDVYDDGPYTPAFATSRDSGGYVYGGYRNFSTSTSNATIDATNTTSIQPGATANFPLNNYTWYWGDTNASAINVGAGLPGTPGNGAYTYTYTLPTGSVGTKKLTLTPIQLRINTGSSSSPWTTTDDQSFQFWREPLLEFTLSNNDTNQIVEFTNGSSYADSYIINWGSGLTTSVANNSAPGGRSSGQFNYNYQTSGLTADGLQSVYITSTIAELNQTYTSSTSTVNVFLVHSPSITATSRLVRPAGSTNTGNITFTNNAMSTTPGLTADYPTNYWYWQWDDGTTSDIDVEVGLAGNAGTNITKNLALSISNGVGIQSQVFDVTASLYTDHPSAPFTSTHALTTYLQPSLDFTLAASGNNLRITNTSLNAGSYVINIQRTTTYGVTTETISIPSNAVAGGSGSTYYSIPVTADTDFSVYLTTTLPGSGTVYTSATKTQKVYAVVSPSFVVESNTSIPTGYPFEFRNTTTNGVLGYTSIFAGNKWRWEWGDGNYTDLNVGAGADGDVNIPIQKIYTLTLAQINAGLPVTFNVTLKAYNGHSSSPFASASQTVTVLPINPNFPNRSFPTLDDAGIPDIVKVKTTQIWGVTGGGNT